MPWGNVQKAPFQRAKAGLAPGFRYNQLAVETPELTSNEWAG